MKPGCHAGLRLVAWGIFEKICRTRAHPCFAPITDFLGTRLGTPDQPTKNRDRTTDTKLVEWLAQANYRIAF
jgi:hypothetical protein